MFKTLFATLMLATSMATPNLQHKPKKAAEETTTINGYYNLKDEMSWPNQSGTFSIVQESDNIEAYVYVNARYYKINNLRLSYSFTNPPTSSLSIAGNVYDWYNDENINISYGASNTTGNYQELKYYDSSNILGLILYFPSSFYYQSSRNNAFKDFFTRENNEFIESYSGYFSFALNYTNSVIIDVRGSFLIDNNLYYEIYDYEHDEMWARYVSYNNENEITKNKCFMADDIAPQNRNIYMNVPKIPKAIKQQFETFGVFDYVEQHVPTSWYDMILSTMDAPIYYLTSMMNFELFGINLFMAFSSILTLVIIVAVIKKVI